MTPSQEPPLPQFIGNASMNEDGTLLLQLFTHDMVNGKRIRGSALFTYAPDSPQYADMLRHIGPIKPGEQKGVRPWPDK
ncbi:MAG: hypothetical protein FWG75_11230 [Cystobacterineae bacterium]|nr:hypothetical protein [Cystobacterineae bacterium]